MTNGAIREEEGLKEGGGGGGGERGEGPGADMAGLLVNTECTLLPCLWLQGV